MNIEIKLNDALQNIKDNPNNFKVIRESWEVFETYLSIPYGVLDQDNKFYPDKLKKYIKGVIRRICDASIIKFNKNNNEYYKKCLELIDHSIKCGDFGPEVSDDTLDKMIDGLEYMSISVLRDHLIELYMHLKPRAKAHLFNVINHMQYKDEPFDYQSSLIDENFEKIIEDGMRSDDIEVAEQAFQIYDDGNVTWHPLFNEILCGTYEIKETWLKNYVDSIIGDNKKRLDDFNLFRVYEYIDKNGLSDKLLRNNADKANYERLSKVYGGKDK